MRAVGLEPVPIGDERAVAMVTGYGPDVVWRDVMRAAIRVRDGLPWVASNADLSLPDRRSAPAPGHGVMVDLLERFAGVEAGGGRQATSGRCWTRPSGAWAASTR